LNYLGFLFLPDEPGLFWDLLGRSEEDLSQSFSWLVEGLALEQPHELEGCPREFSLDLVVTREDFSFKPQGMLAAQGFALQHQKPVYDWACDKPPMWKVWDALAAQLAKIAKAQEALPALVKKQEKLVKYEWHKARGEGAQE
jgi:hypothetical protein